MMSRHPVTRVVPQPGQHLEMVKLRVPDIKLASCQFRGPPVRSAELSPVPPDQALGFRFGLVAEIPPLLVLVPLELLGDLDPPMIDEPRRRSSMARAQRARNHSELVQSSPPRGGAGR